jgi:putative PIN family toxin of toxin-antitoxin system
MPLRKSDRVVFDTNVIVTLLLKEHYEFFVDLKYRHETTLYTCPELLTELNHTLNYPKFKKYLNEPAKYYTQFISDFSKQITIDKRFDRSPDPDDNFLFDLAYTVKSHYLVTGEKALLNMKQVNKIQIVSLTEWKKILNEG